MRRPANWTDSRKNGVIGLQSHDRCLAMTLSAPAPAGRSEGLRADSIALLRRSYKIAKVQPASHAPIGGIPTKSDAVSITGQKGNPIKILLSVGTGESNAYLTEVVVRDPSCQTDLQLANLMIGTIQYTK